MAARGAESKEKVMETILATFPGAFKYEKEIRVPMVENGETIQIKVTLTAAKNLIGEGGDVAMPGAEVNSFATSPAPAQLKQNAATMYPTEEEKANVKNLMTMLGL